MNTKEKAVRDAAAALHTAITDAKKAGLVVVLPAHVDGLLSIAVSETAKSQEAARVTVVAEGVEPGSAQHAKAQKAAEKAVTETTK